MSRIMRQDFLPKKKEQTFEDRIKLNLNEKKRLFQNLKQTNSKNKKSLVVNTLNLWKASVLWLWPYCSLELNNNKFTVYVQLSQKVGK